MHNKGAGTRSSPISIDGDDSEDEVLNELINSNSSSTPLTSSPRGVSEWTYDLSLDPPLKESASKYLNSEPIYLGQSGSDGANGKRKRTDSISSLDRPLPGPRHTLSHPPSLENRLSTPVAPETKRARKRKRKADANKRIYADRLQRLQHAPHLAFPYHSGWPEGLDPFMFPHYQHNVSSHLMVGNPMDLNFGAPTFSLNFPDNSLGAAYFEMEDPPPPDPSSNWVDSMLLAAEQPSLSSEVHQDSQQHIWASASPPSPAPPPHHPPPPLPLQPAVTHEIPHRPSSPKAPEMHTLPHKPPPQAQANQIIGMKPDQDPNSKHGIFLIPGSHDQVTDVKKQQYIPNPARTLVMEQIPKSHRNADFVNSWSKKACGVYPVQTLIDGPSGKALIEFATAELARKAWGSPRLGSSYAGLKSHQLKGKPREDLIKVWWYRVDGIGAGAGVGEIEEGEIEGDAGEKEVDVPERKETKKEKKARMAKEREEKRMKRDQEQRIAREKYLAGSTSAGARPAPLASHNAHTPLPPNPLLHVTSLPPRPQGGFTTGMPSHRLNRLFDHYHDGSNGVPVSANGLVVAKGQSTSYSHSSVSASSVVDGDVDEDMELEGEDVEMVSPAQPISNLGNVATISSATSATPLPSSVYKTPHSHSVHGGNHLNFLQRPSPTLSSNSSTPIPSEPRAMRDAPTAPSHAKRSHEAKRRELEEKIARGKLELEQAEGLNPVSGFQHTSASDAEARLRDLVLKSQKTRNRPAAVNTASSAPMANASVPVALLSTGSPQPATSTTLDDLAVSFIEQSIETAKSKPSVPAFRPPSRVNTRAELAAKQQVLEQHIMETKSLMEKHKQANTKQERGQIMAIMKEKNRALMEADQSKPNSANSYSYNSGSVVNGGQRSQAPHKATTHRWPSLHFDSGVLILSDDEEDDD